MFSWSWFGATGDKWKFFLPNRAIPLAVITGFSFPLPHSAALLYSLLLLYLPASVVLLSQGLWSFLFGMQALFLGSGNSKNKFLKGFWPHLLLILLQTAIWACSCSDYYHVVITGALRGYQPEWLLFWLASLLVSSYSVLSALLHLYVKLSLEELSSFFRSKLKYLTVPVLQFELKAKWFNILKWISLSGMQFHSVCF